MIELESASEGVADESSESETSDTFEIRPIGEYLRRQRLLRQMSIEELASITRIPLRSLERLESGHFDGETDGFVRGFVRTVANALGLDADDAIARMLQEPEPSGPWDGRSPSRAMKQILVTGIFLMFVVVAFFVLRAGWNILLGKASTPASRQVVLWHDPVRALAEARGLKLDPIGEIDPLVRSRSIEVEDAAIASGTRTKD